MEPKERHQLSKEIIQQLANEGWLHPALGNSNCPPESWDDVEEVTAIVGRTLKEWGV